jgi:SAM-dependent methyltransferase
MSSLTTQENEILRIGALAERGQSELAIIEAIRVLASGPTAERPDLLNDLALLLHASGDDFGAIACLRAAVDANPSNDLARANLDVLDVDGDARRDWRSVDAQRATGAATLNPWVVDALRAAERCVGLKQKRVLEVGGSVPVEAVRAAGVAHWTACDLKPATQDARDYTTLVADAAAMPLERDSLDAAYSVCAFEHFDRLEHVLREVHRVLRPSARFFAQFAPIWSCAVGHHVWIMENGQPLVTFNDRVIPRFAHLLLEERELATFLTLTRGADLARRISDYVWRQKYINRLFEGDFRRIVEASPFRVESIEPWGGVTRPQSEMRAALMQRWPSGGDFAAHGLRIVLTK